MGRRSAPRTRRFVDRVAAGPVDLRIIGGSLRGSKLRYSGDPRTRPMKDRLREVVFDLVGPAVKGTHAIDLFAGTGALGLEAISRGAATAVLIEQHQPTARLIEENAEALGVAARVEVVPGDTFIWARRMRPLNHDRPWIVFCSPPYEFYTSRLDSMIALLSGLISAAPPASIFVVETSGKFEFEAVDNRFGWDVRAYAPAEIGILRTPQTPAPEEN